MGLSAADFNPSNIPFYNQKGERIQPTVTAVTPDGNILAAGFGDDSVWLYDLAKGNVMAIAEKAPQRHAPFNSNGVNSLAFSADGGILAVARNGRVNLVNMSDIPNGRDCMLDALAPEDSTWAQQEFFHFPSSFCLQGDPACGVQFQDERNLVVSHWSGLQKTHTLVPERIGIVINLGAVYVGSGIVKREVRISPDELDPRGRTDTDSRN
jgi:WD40 repeat protein